MILHVDLLYALTGETLISIKKERDKLQQRLSRELDVLTTEVHRFALTLPTRTELMDICKQYEKVCGSSE